MNQLYSLDGNNFFFIKKSPVVIRNCLHHQILISTLVDQIHLILPIILQAPIDISSGPHTSNILHPFKNSLNTEIKSKTTWYLLNFTYSK